MKLFGAIVLVGLLSIPVMAYGSTFVIDNFSCADSVSTAGPVFASNVISCPGAIGGVREDVIFFSGGTGTNPSTINSNPPAGAITGTIGASLDAQDILLWTGSTTAGVWNLPNLDLTGDSVLVQIESPSGGTLDLTLGSGAVASTNRLDYTASFPVSSSFVDVLIPLTNPIVTGSGADIGAVTVIGLHVGVAGGGSWTIDGVAAVPEPSTLVLTGICFLGMLARSIWRRSSRQ